MTYFFAVFLLLAGYPAHAESIFERVSPLEMFSFDTDYGAQRCITNHCVCRVRVSKEDVTESNKKISVTGSVYFSESSAELSVDDKASIEEYLRRYPDKKYFTVTGYTDGCGNNSYNYSLAMERARSVRSFIRQKRFDSVVETRAVAEVSKYHDGNARRVDIQTHITKSSFPAYPEVTADVYLIDASGSMSNSYRHWLAAIYQSKKPTSRVYLSYANYCYNGQYANTVKPGGGTEIWYSYWYVLDTMSRGQTLAIISDFDSRVPITSAERRIIRDKVEKKGVRVIAITP